MQVTSSALSILWAASVAEAFVPSGSGGASRASSSKLYALETEEKEMTEIVNVIGGPSLPVKYKYGAGPFPNPEWEAANSNGASAIHDGHGFMIVSEPPSPIKWPIVGTLPDFLARGGVDNFQGMYEDMYAEFGEVYGMSMMGDDELIVSDPRVFDTVLRKEGKYPIGGNEGVTTFLEYYEENNITMGLKSMSRGPEWKEWREPLDPDFYAGWQTFLPMIADCSSKISNVAGYEVTEKQNLAFVDFISRSAFDLFSTVMYGESPQTTDSRNADPQDVEFVKAAQTAFDLTGQVLTNPMEKVFKSDIYTEFEVNMDKTFGFGRKRTAGYVEKAKAKLDAVDDETVVGGEDSKCPVTALKKNSASVVDKLTARGKLTDDQMEEMVAPLLMAGVDTTAYVLSWLFLNIASNPEVQTKLAAELKTVLNGEDITTLVQMNSLPYLKACIRESNRLTPPTPLSAKKLKEDIDVTVGDKTYRVLAGQRVSLNLRAYPLDPRFVEHPTAYQPERFLPDAIKARKGTRSEITDHPSFADPFGRGKRRCLGANVAIAEITILAARMFQDWEISLVNPDDANNWKPKMKLMMKADPYPAMKLVRRA